MKVTAKLAYSQLKVNRSRTRWTLTAIILSTALTTAICSFIASGNAMLVEFLGKDYGAYGKSYKMLLLIPAVILGILIMSMSVTVISNVFQISTKERVMQFGIMKCTGATPGQIRDTVMYESIWLSLAGIPAGIGLGLILALLGIHVANYFIKDLNALAYIMINKINLSVHFVFSWQAVLSAAVLSFLAVLYSAWRPAHKVSRISAIECIHGTGEINTDLKNLHESRLIKRLFGFEGILADRNLKRNHRNFRATLWALSLGVILFISLSGLEMQANAIEKYMNPNIGQTVIAEYTSNYSTKINKKTGKEETIYSHPVNSKRGNQITTELEKFKNTSIFGMGNDRDTFYTILSKDLVTPKMQMVYEKKTAQGYEFPVEIITLDQKNYKKLCEKANVPVGSSILLNHYSYNDFGHQTDLQPFLSEIKNLELVKADGSTVNMPVQGILTQDEMPEELFYPNTNPVRLVVANASVRGFSWFCAPADEEGFIEYANQVLEKEFPEGKDASYMEQGFNTSVYKIKDYVRVINIAISLAAVFMHSFVILLILIGLTNVISTLSANVIMRAREFAVLKSVGMTSEGLRHMLGYESILCSMKALLLGVPIGVIITVLINLPVRSMLPVPYQFPWASVLLCIMGVFFITLGITRYATHKLKDQNIIEAIRAGSGR